MIYSLEFDARALKEWQKLGDTVRQQLKKKLAEVLLNPRVEANRLHSLPDCYKIKLRSSGYRLVYQVLDHEVVVFVVAVIAVSVSRPIARQPSVLNSGLSCSPMTERWSRHDEW
jgi:mRNA interferase RelE/StbE